MKLNTNYLNIHTRWEQRVRKEPVFSNLRIPTAEIKMADAS